VKRSPRFFGAVALMGVTLTACQVTLSTTPKVGSRGAVGYATSILDRAALPAGAEPSSRLPTALIDAAGVPAIPALVDVHRTFVLSRPVNLSRFVETHAPRGATSAGNQRGVGPNHLYEAGYSLSLPTTNRHAAYVLLDYSLGAAASGQGELRVDVHVEWAPIRTVHMPTGTVTLTGYRESSYVNPPSGPVSIVLTPAQADRLRSELASLANAATGGLCMENSRLFMISVAPNHGRTPKWIASAGSCTGLDVERQGHAVVPLNDACSLRRLVGAWLPKVSTAWRQSMFWDCPPGA
jgi:hypothetical protein